MIAVFENLTVKFTEKERKWFISLCKIILIFERKWFTNWYKVFIIKHVVFVQANVLLTLKVAISTQNCLLFTSYFCANFFNWFFMFAAEKFELILGRVCIGIRNTTSIDIIRSFTLFRHVIANSNSLRDLRICLIIIHYRLFWLHW